MRRYPGGAMKRIREERREKETSVRMQRIRVLYDVATEPFQKFAFSNEHFQRALKAKALAGELLIDILKKKRI